jgi:magnesium chelatase accessory protein
MSSGVWRRDPLPWPHAAPSRLVAAGGVRWLVQSTGKGPVMLLVHGAGASIHSWRRLLPFLAHDFTVVAVDLPGHGLSSRPASAAAMSLPRMASALADLLQVLEIKPAVAVGHSAGAAVLAAMSLWHKLRPAVVIALNGALLPLPGLRGMFFSPLAKITAASGLIPRLFAWRATDPRAIERLIAGTGSHLDREGVALYQRLASYPPHVAATLDMMARWDLTQFVRDLPRLRSPLELVVGEKDLAVLPRQAEEVAALLKGVKIHRLKGLGHLAHEEDPEGIAGLTKRLYAAHSVSAPL